MSRPLIDQRQLSRSVDLIDIIVVPTSSSITNTHPKIHTFLQSGEGGLSRECYARCEQVTTIDKDLLSRGPLGPPISDKYLWNIVRCIRQAIGDTDIW